MSDTPALPAVSRAWHLVSRPVGWPQPDNFALVEAPLPEPAEGQVLVRNEYLSVDPYMRGRMSAAKSYAAPYELDKPMQGGAVGEVVVSRAEGIAVGDRVLHSGGWREYTAVDARQAVKVDPEAAPLSAYLGVLGMPGLTAYVGLLRVASLKEGDVVFVSGAAGAVGSLVGQLAKLKGASRVVGSAGSDEKVDLLRSEYGFDAAFNYKKGPVKEQLRAAAPDGIDVYFDNVGGEHLEAAIGSLNLGGRIAICGMISTYNDTEPSPGPRNLVRLIQTRGRIEGFLVGDHYHLQPQFVEEVGPWVRSGELKYRETVVEGIENTLEAFLGVLRGDNTGKMVVKL
ncbi:MULTISPECIES: NADP-dependent oxidoreductase [Streptomyces]|uniref:NADP-dependent oxidoreductase n=1 Tax=Streptomyces thermoviolaceus subsp. thermoviolaceus TaxID=66860 RepID=A0ABX0YRT0_STRTL|nr:MULTISPECIES: NADP-dependent oxidoreductase [Streptomyces]WTD49383.1 NADP-dependent oxidoreductase [Streptomyces thermoviolaceus]NJP13755.1 NADP-dependent oxidoreductase [Streptomyces thermoviolaceus subsp. thermoviolaceus]RSS05468.1 NADP-dependent oxidoreductase [Streptomyces sp. WAC00469]GGV60835.1 NADP-dependent oxidoreductase [Streptomyces thermoviolaceus subsp. apingens]GHA97889.1 NADP-dependent oxidoreductase [Streptomyces thermoviolaceus subsp. thermoviolaceus]